MELPSTKDILTKARELISDEKHWIKGEYGVTAAGWPVDQEQLHEASCFCAIGAIVRAMQILRKDDTLKRTPSELYAMLHLDSLSLIIFNDRHTHPEVLKLFDDMIDAA